MKTFLAIVGLVTAAITGLVQYNKPQRRKERKLRGLDKKLNQLEEQSAQAWLDEDMVAVAVLERDIRKLHEQARRIAQ